MTTRLLTILLIVASVGSGLMGGLFFTFSNTVMSAFDRLPAGGGMPNPAPGWLASAPLST